MPKVVMQLFGLGSGGGHSYVVCDLTLASKEHAIFKQTDAMLPVLMGIWFPHYLTKMVGRKKP
jgi:naphthoate synthase